MYPSGQWEGFWFQEAFGKQKMTAFTLRFANGEIGGEGRDLVGRFTFSGAYDIANGDIVMMKQYAFRHAESTLGPGRGQRQIHLSRERVREVVEHEGGLVREDPLLLRPEPEGCKVLVLTGREVDDAVDATPNADNPPVLFRVLDEELRRVTRERRLLCREVPILSDRELEEAVPARSGLDVGNHEHRT